MQRERVLVQCEECGRDQDPSVAGTVVYKVTLEKLEPHTGIGTVEKTWFRNNADHNPGRVLCARCIGADVLRRFG